VALIGGHRLNLKTTMDVTRDNFLSYYSEVLGKIKECTFIAFDTEFTGLLDDGIKENWLDTPSERYEKLKHGTSQFLVIQYGLCLFTKISPTKYTAEPYNFWLFPGNPTSTSDVRFLCQASSIMFLTEHNFDFNKWVKEGVYFLSKPEAKKYDEYKQRMEDRKSNRVEVIDPEDQAFVANVKEQIEALLNNPKTPGIEVECVNSYKRKLVYQVVEDNFKDSQLIVYITDNDKLLAVKKPTSKLLKDMEKKKEAKKNEEIKYKGFLHIIEALVDSGKLLVGHNCLLDILHTYRQFLNPLPDTFDEFKTILRSTFPKLMDTKLIGSTDPVKPLIPSTHLGDAFSTVCNPQSGFPKVEVKLPKKCNSKNTPHTAWYDAYMTGVCFATYNAFLEVQLKTPEEKPGNFLAEFPVMNPFLNRIFFLFSNDMTYIDLAAPDTIPNRSHIFHLTFDSSVQASDIYNLFSPFGRIGINWLCKTSAFVTVMDKTKSEDCFKALKLSGLLADKPFMVQTYEQFQNLKREVQGVDTARSEEKRKLEVSNKENGNTVSVEEKLESVPKKTKLFDEGDW